MSRPITFRHLGSRGRLGNQLAFEVGGRRVLIDQEDMDLVEGRTWRLHRSSNGRTFYVRASTGEYLHRLICVCGPGEDLGHRNGDGLDNRRTNLRPVPHRLNMANQAGHGGSSRFKGVCWDRARGKWTAGLKVDGVRRNLGRFDSEDEAARAYDAEAIRVWGDYAKVNL